MPKCVCCFEETDIDVCGAPHHCSKCRIILERYFEAKEKQDKFFRELQGYAPIQINNDVPVEYLWQLQEINDSLEKTKLELHRLQVCSFNLGQTISSYFKMLKVESLTTVRNDTGEK